MGLLIRPIIVMRHNPPLGRRSLELEKKRTWAGALEMAGGERSG